MTALYLSMNANPRELEIEDDLARGTLFVPRRTWPPSLTAV